jgi:hypothetical protein
LLLANRVWQWGSESLDRGKVEDVWMLSPTLRIVCVS